MGIWWILLTKFKKHSVYHLVIPLLGGLAVEGIVEAVVLIFFSHHPRLVTLTHSFWFHLLTLISGVCISWFIVMVILINQETKKRVEEEALARLEETLDDATSYYGVSVIPLTEWFDPAIQIYVTKILSRALQRNGFRHERTLLFFSDKDYERCRTELLDEYYYGKCLAHMHRDCGIPLSFMKRADVDAVMHQLDDKYKASLGWTNNTPTKHRRRLFLRRIDSRIDNLDFGLVTKPDDSTAVLRVSKCGEKVVIKDILEGDAAEPYSNLVRQIKKTVYKSSRLKRHHNFLRNYGFSDSVQPRQFSDSVPPKQKVDPSRRYEEYRKVLFERLPQRAKAQFKIKKCTRLITIHDGSGDATDRIAFEDVRSYPEGKIRDKMPLSFKSKSGFSRAPKIIGNGGVRWEWDKSSSSEYHSKGFIVFNSPLKDHSISFTMETEMYNAFYFNQRDRLDVAESIEESVSVSPENLYESYVLQVQFPSRHFPNDFKIHAINELKKRNHKEEKLIQPGLIRVGDSTIMLTIDKPLAGYTYKIVWTLAENDIDESGQSGGTALLMRETIKRLATLGSDASKAQSVTNHLNELKEQFANARFGPDAIGDAELELTLHAFSDKHHGLIVVASTITETANVIPVGKTTVGQAYRRRALVSWVLDADSDDSTFWDYGQGHCGIISIPLFYPVAAGIRTCVLSIATKSASSGLLKIIQKLHERDMRQVFLQHINVWYATSLAGALGLPDLRPNTRRESRVESHSQEEA
jgi:hypothetical protein